MRPDRSLAPSWRLGRVVGAAVAAALGAACVTVTTVTIGTKTSLERQLAGEVEPLSEEQLLAASVRAEAQVSGGSLADLQAAAVAARRRQLFNRDDIDEGKKQGCLGETREARLTLRPCEPAKDPAVATHLAALVAQENEDRLVVIDWAIAADAALTPADRLEVVRVYRRLLLEASRQGDWVQGDDGGWTRR
jgi:uncharacterized protein YdbL (DUF1318 family)